MIIKNNKGQVASTFTWFAGFLIIFFIMFLFLIASLGIAAQKKVSGKLGSVEVQGVGGNLIISKEMVSFLNKQVGVDSVKMRFSELICQAYKNYPKDSNNIYVQAFDAEMKKLNYAHFSEVLYFQVGMILGYKANYVLLGAFTIPYANSYLIAGENYNFVTLEETDEKIKSGTLLELPCEVSNVN
ncbi:MAG: hypothetical protein NT076_01835 [Candidatus Pacearchaeota archaeon]|nr:hypothetical protein [Candidatus Pacearchaeota archaeon]